MKTELEILIEQYPKLEYEDGFLYPDSDEDGYLVDGTGKPLDGTSIIEDHFEGYDICTNPNEPDPTKEVYAAASGKANIDYWHNGDYDKAIKSLK